MSIPTIFASICLLASAAISTAAPLWLGAGDLEAIAPPVQAESSEIILDPRLLDIPSEQFTLGVEVADIPLTPAADPRPDWIVRLEYAIPTSNTLSEISSGDIDIVENNESYCLTLGRYLKRDLWGLPLDLSLNGSVCFHPSNPQQDDIFQYLLWVQLHWTSFPWNDHLRTRVALGEGLSYVEHIPYSELVRRDMRPSVHLLNYLELSVSLNLADLLNVTRLNNIIPGGKSPALDNAWLVGSIHHRSGAKGLFGKYEDENGNKHDITGGDNLFVLGVAVEF